jgi:hypothetical protein
MGKRGSLSGGGIESRQVSNVNAPKAEPKPHSVSVGSVSRLGGMMGVGADHKPLYLNQRPFSNPIGPTPMTPDQCKVGGARTILKSGSQSSTPRVSSPSKSKPYW